MADLTSERTQLPSGVDLILSRDALQHSTHADVWRILATYVRTNARYLLVGSYPGHELNRRIRTGQNSHINLAAPPFALRPAVNFSENLDGKYLYLYRVPELCHVMRERGLLTLNDTLYTYKCSAERQVRTGGRLNMITRKEFTASSIIRPQRRRLQSMMVAPIRTDGADAISNSYLAVSALRMPTTNVIVNEIGGHNYQDGRLALATRLAIRARIQRSQAAVYNSSVAGILLPSETAKDYDRTCRFLVGNRIHEFLNTIMAAVVTGSALIRSDPHFTCNGNLQSTLEFEALAKLTAEAAKRATPISNCVDSFEDTVSQRLKLHFGSLYQLNTCKALHGHQYSAARFQAQEVAVSAPLDPEIFALGPHFLYGEMFKHFFEFRSPVATERNLIDTGNVVRISMHLRHRSLRFDGSEMVAAAMHEADRLGDGRQCQVLLSADRRLTISLVEKSASRCRVTYIRRPEAKQARLTHFLENGPDTGDTAFQDVELLSHGHHLIGTFGSTFTLLVQELIAARWSGQHGITGLPQVVYCDPMHGCMEHGLPLITNVEHAWHMSLQRWPEAHVWTSLNYSRSGSRARLKASDVTVSSKRTELALPRVALQISGHLRDICSGSAPAGQRRSPLLQLEEQVDSCRRYALCDVYLHTWDRLYPSTTNWHTKNNTFCLVYGCLDPEDAAERDQSSEQCLAKLSRVIHPTAVAVQRQPFDLGDQYPSLGNATWRTITTHGSHGSITHGVSLAGSRAMIQGIAAALDLRRSRQQPYDLAVRLRPDLHRYGVARIQNCMWPHMLREATMGGTMIHGCAISGSPGNTNATAPGGKNGDTCLWGAPSNLDLVISTWNTTALEELERNMCYARHGLAHGPSRCGKSSASMPVAQTAESLLKSAIARSLVDARSGEVALAACRLQHKMSSAV